ncbi:MAG: hypothetical protein DMD87_14890 [Candidatus Rokuibacteriota bacterium]|nr:MAG: hypothetical protein DMD87_14890 [Candidatus Rokubacteria bacterium]
MPLSYRIDPSAEMVLIVGVGFITQSERIAAIQTWLRDPGFRPGPRTLCDFSEVTSTPTMKELREIVSIVDEHAAAIGKKKLAVIASRPVTFGVARQFQTLADFGPLDVEVFKDRRAALGWLRHGESQS